jgi:ubiquinone/menaquinone biosynthesis C-methylase UbiE
MNALGRALLNNPARAAAQARVVVPAMQRLGADFTGQNVLEIGCGRGVGMELLADPLGAKSVHGVDLDPVMVELARRRLGDHAQVELGDMAHLNAPAEEYDAVVDFGAVHLEPAWRQAIAEVARVLRPSGLFAFEEIVGPVYRAGMPIATGRPIRSGFSRASLLAELRRNGFEMVGTTDPRWWVLTGTVGDLIGVARIAK